MDLFSSFRVVTLLAALSGLGVAPDVSYGLTLTMNAPLLSRIPTPQRARGQDPEGHPDKQRRRLWQYVWLGDVQTDTALLDPKSEKGVAMRAGVTQAGDLAKKIRQEEGFQDMEIQVVLWVSDGMGDYVKDTLLASEIRNFGIEVFEVSDILDSEKTGHLKQDTPQDLEDFLQENAELKEEGNDVTLMNKVVQSVKALQEPKKLAFAKNLFTFALMYTYGGWVFDATTIFPKTEDMLEVERAANFARHNGFLEQDFEDKRVDRRMPQGRAGIRLPMCIFQDEEDYPCKESFDSRKMSTERLTNEEFEPYDIDIFFFGSLRGHPSWRFFLQATLCMYARENYDILEPVIIRGYIQRHHRDDAGVAVAACELDPKQVIGWDMPELGGLRKLHLRTWKKDGGKEIDGKVLEWLQEALDSCQCGRA